MANQTEIHPMVPPLLQRLRAFGTETAVLFQRSALKLVRRPVMLYFSLVQPVVWLLLFGQLQAEKVTYAHGIPGLLGGMGIALLFGLGLAAFNVLAALRTRNTETAFLIANFLTLPLLFTSSAQLPVQLLPTWLQDVARVNPVTYAVSSMRILLNGSQSASSATPGIYILETVAILGGITVVFLVLAARTFRRSVH
jgi:ABC-type multidrug transport system permease subunit